MLLFLNNPKLYCKLSALSTTIAYEATFVESALGWPGWGLTVGAAVEQSRREQWGKIGTTVIEQQ